MKIFRIMKIAIAIIFSFIFIFSCKPKSSQKETIVWDGNDFYKIEAIDIDSGWVYKIWLNDKVLINQTMIPAVNGRFTFETKENAEITATFVLQKIITEEGFPSVSFEDLDSLGVLSQAVIDYQKIDFSTKTGIRPKDY